MLGDCRKLAEVGVQDCVSGRSRDAGIGEQAGGPRREVRVVFAPCGDEVVHDGDPVAVIVVEAVPQGAKTSPRREIGQQRRLAIARFRQDEHQALMDLGVQPVKQAVARQDVVAKWRRLDLRRLDREGVHLVSGLTCALWRQPTDPSRGHVDVPLVGALWVGLGVPGGRER